MSQDVSNTDLISKNGTTEAEPLKTSDKNGTNKLNEGKNAESRNSKSNSNSDKETSIAGEVNTVSNNLQKENKNKKNIEEISWKIGAKCKLKDSTTHTVNNQNIPKFAYRNIYSVKNILRDRIIIKAGLTYTLAVKSSDIIKYDNDM